MPVKLRQLVAFLILPASLVLFPACDDPTSAGLELAGGPTGEPVAYAAAPSTFESAEIEDITGNSASVLTGQVADPLLGTIETKGYIDFILAATSPDGFAAGPVTAASLKLDVQYLYGDTTAVPILSINGMNEDWGNTGANSDTVLISGANILSTSVDVADSSSVISIDLPQSWVTANDSTLRSVFFSSSFNGFELTTDASNLVAGFNLAGSSLEVVSGGDTVTFPAAQAISSITTLSQPVLPADRILVQDGTRNGIEFDIDHTKIDSLSDAVLSSLILSVTADTNLLNDNTPVNFVRPPVESLVLVGTVGDSLDFDIETVTLDEDGRFVFRSTILRDALQQQIISDTVFESYSLRIPDTQNTIGSVVLYSPTSETSPPQLNIVASLLE